MFTRPGRVKCWVYRLAGARQGYRYGRAKQRSGGPFCGHGPRYTSSCVYLVPLVRQEEEEEAEAEAKPRGAAHTAVNTTSLRPQTSVVPHRSSVLPVHMYARSVFLHLSVCECRLLFLLRTQTDVRFLIRLVCVCVRARPRAHAVCKLAWHVLYVLSVCVQDTVKIFFSFYLRTTRAYKSVTLACVVYKLVRRVFASVCVYTRVRSATPHTYRRRIALSVRVAAPRALLLLPAAVI